MDDILSIFLPGPKIKEVYLRKNCITDLGEITYLRNLPRLQVLWLSDNPCTEDESYRATIIRNLPNLKKLDNAGKLLNWINYALLSSSSIA